MTAIEVAVYRSTDPTTLATRHRALHEALAGFDGFLRSLALRRVDEPEVFADVIEWRSTATALRAAERLPTETALAWFPPLVGELAFFGHVRLVSGDHDVLTRAADAPLVEIAVTRPADPTAYVAANRLVHEDLLGGREGVLGHAGLQGESGADDGPAPAVDLIAWSAAEVMQQVGAELSGRAELAAMVDENNEQAVFALFAATGSAA